MEEKQPAVYILSSRRNGTLYVGVTSDLERRIWQHRNSAGSSFTRQYEVNRLVYIELCESIFDAIQREKQLKRWKRSWKLALIESMNPDWKDLWNEQLIH